MHNKDRAVVVKADANSKLSVNKTYEGHINIMIELRSETLYGDFPRKHVVSTILERDAQTLRSYLNHILPDPPEGFWWGASFITNKEELAEAFLRADPSNLHYLREKANEFFSTEEGA